ncbi:MAG: hypothetical protein SGJ24_07175 [Chloroflexota bacterium]|nr:hypothetical protein [Chloroflexota bacterium]
MAALPTALAPPANGTSIIGGIPTSTVPAIGNPLITPGMGGAAARGGATIVPVPGVSATPVLAASPNANAPALSNIQVSARVGADDCAISPSPSFNTGVTELYLVATATNIAPGMTISSRWTRDGVEVAFYEWTPDFAVNGACIWFLAPGAEVDLSTGSWNVQLAIDGAAVGSSGFTING